MGVGLVVGVGVAALRAGEVASVVVGAFFLGVCIYRYQHRFAAFFLRIISLALAGYALFGRGFAYAGIGNVFVGEVLLAMCVLYLLVTGPAWVVKSPVFWLLGLLALLGSLGTLQFVGTYGLLALRDAAIWGYGLFAMAISALIVHSDGLRSLVVRYSRFVPVLLIGGASIAALTRYAGMPVPSWPDSGVPVISVKSGDLGVHLAGAMAFISLGLAARKAPQGVLIAEWGLWIAWLVAFAVTFDNRGAILTVISVGVVLILMRPRARWGKLAAVSVLVVAVFITADIEIPITRSRSISLQTIAVALQSILGETGEVGFDGTRQWRLEWWREIVTYTFFGDYFWTGKGYGVNLADSDGFQVAEDQSLRSPHNAHLTLLARSGVPGLLVWLGLQIVFVSQLLLSHRRALSRGHRWWSNLFVWLLLYWLAFMINATVDVFLEGPQGGIWFWSLIGLGVAAMETYRRMFRSSMRGAAASAICPSPLHQRRSPMNVR